MIRRIFIFGLCFVVTCCSGFTVGSGLKFNNGSRFVKLKDNSIVDFNKPIGECGGGVVFFGILFPIIPVWINLNSCKQNLFIKTSRQEIVNVKLKYNGVIYEGILTEKQFETMDNVLYSHIKQFKFKIPNFWQFRMADDKAIIIYGKDKNEKEFVEELPVKWGVVIYNQWALPGV